MKTEKRGQCSTTFDDNHSEDAPRGVRTGAGVISGAVIGMVVGGVTGLAVGAVAGLVIGASSEIGA